MIRVGAVDAGRDRRQGYRVRANDQASARLLRRERNRRRTFRNASGSADVAEIRAQRRFDRDHFGRQRVMMHGHPVIGDHRAVGVRCRGGVVVSTVNRNGDVGQDCFHTDDLSAARQQHVRNDPVSAAHCQDDVGRRSCQSKPSDDVIARNAEL
jgi:hypothetical protein